MFYQPTRNVKIKNFEELKKFSICMKGYVVDEPKKFCQYQEQVVFVTEEKIAYVCPERDGIFDIMKKEGYEEGDFFVINQEKSFIEKLYATIKGKQYNWFLKMKKEEENNLLYERLHMIAEEKGIKSVKFDEEQLEVFRDVSEADQDLDGYTYTSMTNPKYALLSKENVGTYIRTNSKTVLLCDEYGRTFLLKFGLSANEFVNKLNEAGYKPNCMPWNYVWEKTFG